MLWGQRAWLILWNQGFMNLSDFHLRPSDLSGILDQCSVMSLKISHGSPLGPPTWKLSTERASRERYFGVHIALASWVCILLCQPVVGVPCIFYYSVMKVSKTYSTWLFLSCWVMVMQSQKMHMEIFDWEKKQTHRVSTIIRYQNPFPLKL